MFHRAPRPPLNLAPARSCHDDQLGPKAWPVAADPAGHFRPDIRSIASSGKTLGSCRAAACCENTGLSALARGFLEFPTGVRGELVDLEPLLDVGGRQRGMPVGKNDGGRPSPLAAKQSPKKLLVRSGLRANPLCPVGKYPSSGRGGAPPVWVCPASSALGPGCGVLSRLPGARRARNSRASSVDN